MEVEDYKCPACSAPLKYNPESESWKCEHCLTNYNIEALFENEKKFFDLENKETIDVDEYTCPNCGAKIITNENTSATFCVYCDNTAIIKNRLTGVLKPDGIIPFKITKEDAKKSFLNFRRKKLTPTEFGKKEQIEKLTGLYIPFWIYDCEAQIPVMFTGNNIYFYFRKVSAHFNNIPVDGAVNFSDSIMDAIEPFDYNEITEFSPAYLSGFLAEKYDVNGEIIYQRIREKIFSELSQDLDKKIRDGYFRTDWDKGYAEIDKKFISLRINDNDIKYVLLPVWILNIKYKDKVYIYAINGQTGKVVGEVPISKIKFGLMGLGISLITFLLAFMFFIGFAKWVFLIVGICAIVHLLPKIKMLHRRSV